MKPIPWSCILLASSINTAQAISPRPYAFNAQAVIVNNAPCFYITSTKADRPYAGTEILVYEKQVGGLNKIWQVWGAAAQILGRASLSFSKQIYTTATVYGRPNKLKRLKMAARTCSPVTCPSKHPIVTLSPNRLKQYILVST